MVDVRQCCAMVGSFHLFIAFLPVCVAANRVYPPTKVIKLTLGVSKATYLPFPSRRFIQNGRIIENPSTTEPRLAFGIIPLPPKYNQAQDKIACSSNGWTANSYENKDTEVLMFKNVQQKLVVFGFRGTEPTNIKDWLRNFNVVPAQSTIDRTTFTTHKGFRDRYGFVASWFEREYSNVPQNYTIVITGHSLGAAEATIAAVFAAGKLKRRPDAVVTYGSPFPGKQNFKNYYNQVVGCDRTLRITAKGDITTGVPRVFRYQHVCGETKVDAGRLDYYFNLLKAHSLYHGYENGIKKTMHSKAQAINFGCNSLLN